MQHTHTHVGLPKSVVSVVSSLVLKGYYLYTGMGRACPPPIPVCGPSMLLAPHGKC